MPLGVQFVAAGPVSLRGAPVRISGVHARSVHKTQRTARAIDLSDNTHYEYDPVNVQDFAGFTSDEPITWMTIEAPDLYENAWPTMDHFYVGAAPAPGVLALLGLAGLARSRRR